MTRISYLEGTDTTLTVYISGLDKNFSGGLRMAYWYVAKIGDDYPESANGYQTLDEGISSTLENSGIKPAYTTLTFEELSASTEYKFKCIISVDDGEKIYDVELEEAYFWTENKTPGAIINRVFQVPPYGNRICQVDLRVFDIVHGISKFLIEAKKYGSNVWYAKTDEIVCDGPLWENVDGISYIRQVEDISFDNYATYQVRVKVWTGEEGIDQVISYSSVRVIEIKEPLVEITSVYIDEEYPRTVHIKWQSASDYEVCESYIIAYKNNELRYQGDIHIGTNEKEVFPVSNYGNWVFEVRMDFFETDGIGVVSKEWVEFDIVTIGFKVEALPPVINYADACQVKNNVKTIRISFEVLNYDTPYTVYKIHIRKKEDASWVLIDAGSISDDCWKIDYSTDVNEFAVYEVMVSVTTYETTVKEILTIEVEGSETSRPSNWDWYASNGLADAAMTTKALGVVNGINPVVDFNYLVWNDLVRKATEFLVYTKNDTDEIGENELGYDSKLTYGDIIDEALCSANENVLGALKFNILTFCVNHINDTALPSVKYKDNVYGTLFKNIVNAINSTE